MYVLTGMREKRYQSEQLQVVFEFDSSSANFEPCVCQTPQASPLVMDRTGVKNKNMVLTILGTACVPNSMPATEARHVG